MKIVGCRFKYELFFSTQPLTVLLSYNIYIPLNSLLTLILYIVPLCHVVPLCPWSSIAILYYHFITLNNCHNYFLCYTNLVDKAISYM